MINLIPTVGVILFLFEDKIPAVNRDKMTNMIATSKNKIVEVLAYAREVSISKSIQRDTPTFIYIIVCKHTSILKAFVKEIFEAII
jgi:hypothetical protein